MRLYRFPIERMTNINVDPGHDGTLEDIISSTERGVILAGDKSWSIGSNRRLHFSTDIAGMLKTVNAKASSRTVLAKTLDFYRSLTAVGDESTWRVQYVDNCGKGAPGQAMLLGRRSRLPIR